MSGQKNFFVKFSEYRSEHKLSCWDEFVDEFPQGTGLDDVTPLRSRTASNGHAGDGGIQSHSLGEPYPLAVYATGDGRWCVWSCLSGVTFGEFGTAKAAFGRARQLAELATRCWQDAESYDTDRIHELCDLLDD